MSPRGLPSRSDSPLRSGTPADSSKPDYSAVTDVFEKVEETGSLEAAARQLQSVHNERRWQDDLEEAEYRAQTSYNADDGDEVAVVEVEHLQEVIEGLWLGDLVAAMDTQGLEERGITNILSLLRPSLKFAPQFAHYPLEIEDSADTDILTHLPSCVAWIQEVLDRRRQSINPSISRPAIPSQDKVDHGDTAQTKPGGVLVHCQAGMSRSATVVAAYLMQTMDLDPTSAVDMIKGKRPVIDPSDTFLHQLGLFYNADGQVSLRDRSTRQFYMERTTSQFLNGDGGAPSLDKMARYPATPTMSNPPSPMGGHGRRKIRCKMCRRHLAVREHMMDHILDQAPIYRPRTPSNFAHASPGMSRGESATLADRRPSTVSDVINPLTGQPGETTRSRRSSMSSSAPSPIQLEHHIESNKESGIDKQGLTPSSGVPWPRTWPRTAAPGMVLTSSSPEVHGAGRLLGDLLPASPLITSSRPRSTSQISPAEGPRQFQTAGELASRLPAHLQALRATPPSANGSASPIESSSTAPSTGPNVGLRKRSSLLGTDSCDVQGGGRGNGGDADNLATFATSGLPILVNPKCSGYFVEPLTWMEPVLRNGDIAGKLLCPNAKCGIKIGNFDWAGVQCGCKEWVTPGFCIHRSKVDEVW